MQDGTVTADFPTHQTDFHHAQPVYQELAGLGQTDISGAADLADLPANARRYLEFVEERLGVPVAMVGVGPRRDQTINVREVLRAA